MSNTTTLPTAKKDRSYLVSFFLAMVMATIMFIPFLVYDKGYFFFFGDFNVQQIPFYQLAHQAVRSGDLLWSWYTDLGANFIASYSFYLLFSPFFWLTLLFPTSFVPHLMAPLLILKISCMALTAHLFIRRFVKDWHYVTMGSLLYAFSGFSIYNIFFNHFHEAMVFFPLLLIALEELVQHRRRGWFALAVAVNCIVNYWFFIGEVVFVVLYVFVRMTDPSWGMTPRRFFAVALESVLGVLLAMVVLLPSALVLIGNPRTTADNLLDGWNFWIYWDDQRPLAILQSIFFPPDLPSRPNFFPEHGAKWSSLTAWLPLFSASGVIAYLFAAQRSWLKKMLWISLALAMMPGPNSVFVLFNHSYYARWFYMPILLMALATAIALERPEIDFLRGVRWCGGIILLFIVMVGLTPDKVEGKWKIGLMDEPIRFWMVCALALGCLGMTFYIVERVRMDHRYVKKMMGLLSVTCVVHGIFFLASGRLYGNSGDFLRETALAGREAISLPEEEFARVDLYKEMDNLGMYWHLPNIQAFHSVIPNSIMEFYPEVGVKRDVSSKPDVENYALRPLLSVKYLIVKSSDDSGATLMPGYHYAFSQLGYDFYENDNFLPMGFGYDRTFDLTTLRQIPVSMRTNFMLRALYLEEEALARNQDIAPTITEPTFDNLDVAGMEEDVADRRAYACESFERDNLGFTATCNNDKDVLMFFSVPYEKGWRATVNGVPQVVEKANIGFMAVRVPAGPAIIRFDYVTPGLIPGGVVTVVGMVLLVVYLVAARRQDLRRDAAAQAAAAALELTAQEEQTHRKVPADDSAQAAPERPIPENFRSFAPQRERTAQEIDKESESNE